MAISPHRSVPGIDESIASEVASLLEQRLYSTLDLQLVLKHIHWNVVGPNFISVHEMLDEHTDAARAMSDELAERIRTLGGVPVGTPQAIVDGRSWNDYARGRGLVSDHLIDLDSVYSGIIEDHRKIAAAVSDLDPVTEDLLISQIGQLELFQWFVRSFVEAAA